MLRADGFHEGEAVKSLGEIPKGAAIGAAAEFAFLSASRDRTAATWLVGDAVAAEPGTITRGSPSSATPSTSILSCTTLGPLLDGQPLVITCGLDKLVMLWNAESTGLEGVLMGHDENVKAAAIAQPSLDLVTGSWGPDVHRVGYVQRAAACDREASHQCGHGLASIPVWNAWDRHLGQPSAFLRKRQSDCAMVDREPHTVLQHYEGHTNIVQRVVLLPPSSGWFASAANDETVRIWDLETGAQLQRLSGHHSFVYAVGYNSLTNELLSVSEDKTLRIWRSGDLFTPTSPADNDYEELRQSAMTRAWAQGPQFRCVQSVPHPELLWDVMALDNGDVVTASQDSAFVCGHATWAHLAPT